MVLDGSWWFLVVLGGSWWFLVVLGENDNFVIFGCFELTN